MSKFAFVTFLTFVRAPLVVLGTALALVHLARPAPATLAAALALLALSALTDLFDGKLARKWGVTSRLGALADPLMDKVFFLFTLPAATFMALRTGDAPHAWALLALDAVSAFRDQWASFLRSVGSEFRADVRASFSGKLRTFLAFPIIMLVILQLGLSALRPEVRPAAFRTGAMALEGLLLFMTVFSGGVLTARFWPYLRRAAAPDKR